MSATIQEREFVTRQVDEQDIVFASWEIAKLLYGPDDGTEERDDIECQIQEVIKASFEMTCGCKGLAEMQAKGW
jgi:hypothetical protein